MLNKQRKKSRKPVDSKPKQKKKTSTVNKTPKQSNPKKKESKSAIKRASKQEPLEHDFKPNTKLIERMENIYNFQILPEFMEMLEEDKIRTFGDVNSEVERLSRKLRDKFKEAFQDLMGPTLLKYYQNFYALRMLGYFHTDALAQNPEIANKSFY